MTIQFKTNAGEVIELSEFEDRVHIVLASKSIPMGTIYAICRLMNQSQRNSRSKFYVKVYRAAERLVEKGVFAVERGTRDPSVYLAKSQLKGRDKYGAYEIPF